MSPWHAFLSGLGRACAALARTWWRRATTRRALRNLDARLLADIGRTEAERRRECAKRFWQG
ncbi:MAG: DUF1127 domain-containing protein [Rhodospirillaceae bacterium]|nr:DUF1127 domain-containing protein [Rhodospirillaceae bacterium]